MTDLLLAIAILVGVPCCLMLLGTPTLEQIRLIRQEWAQARQFKQKIAAESARRRRLELLEQELQRLEEDENRR